MASQDIIVKYRADVDDLTNQLRIVVERMDKLEQESKASAKGVDQLTKSVDKLDKELATTGKSTKQATDNVKNFSKTAKADLSAVGTQARSIGLGIAGALGAAFTVDALVNFSKASVNAFLEAQVNAEKLRFTITQVGGESELAFQRLIDQSAKLQDITIFSDDSIQQAQAALATFDLTSQEIEALLPLLADYASATKTDIVAAAQAVGAGLQGTGREFKKYGIEVSATATATENLAEITKGFTRFQGAAAKETETLTGQLKQQANAADELQESLGARLAESFVAAKLAAFEFFSTIIDGLEGVDKLQAQGEISDRERLALRIQADLQGRATVNNLTLQANAEKELIETGRLLRENQAEIIQNEIKQNPQRLTFLQNQRKELTQTAGVLTEIIELEKNRIENEKKIAGRDVTQASDARIAGSAKEIELIKALGAEYNDLLKLLGDPQKLQLFELASIAEIESASEIKDKIKILEDVLKENKIKIPVAVDADKPIQDARLRFNQLKAALEAEGINIDISLDDLSLNNLKAEVAKLVIEMQKELTVELKLEVPEDRKFVTMNTGIKEIVKSDLELWFERNEQILNSSVDLLNDLAALYDQYQQNRIDQINEERDIKLAALDTEQQSIDDQLKKRRLSETEAQKLTEELTAKRLATEAAAAKKEQALKKKQFDIDKAAALIQIIINTAEAVTAALTIPPPAGTILAALNAAAGAAEAALVAGQPNPYKKGTKSAKEGLALVDEEGTEAIYRGRLTTLERGDKVLTAPKTKTYGAVLDAMIDNTFDRYIMKTYVAPVLEKQVKQDKAVKQKSFEQNVIESIYINKAAGLTEYGLEKVWRKGNYVTNADDIGKSVARHLQKDIYR